MDQPVFFPRNHFLGKPKRYHWGMNSKGNLVLHRGFREKCRRQHLQEVSK